MRVLFYCLLSFVMSSGFFSDDSLEPAFTAIENDPDYTLVWSDEFDEDGAPDPDKWFHQTYAPADGSWFNGEEQHYTDRLENSVVENGVLKIIAKKETFNNGQSTKEYTSARLNSKFAFTYGKVIVRAKMPEGDGTWPAIWMLGQNITETGGYWQTQGFGTTPWPATGEIDIMEHWGDDPNVIHGSTHTPSSYGATVNTSKTTVTDATEFHEYAIEWDANEIRFFVDELQYYTYNPAVKNAETWPFDDPQYLLLNVAMGGIYITPGVDRIDPDFTESAMEIDYVRVYEESIPLVQDARLSDLKVNGETISGFNINRTEYTYFLKEEESEIPTVSYSLINENATVTLNEATSLPGTTIIEVTSEDQSSTRTIAINFKRPLTVPIDFESTEISYEFVNFEGGFAEVIANPDPDIINMSEKVLRNTKFDGATFGGVVLPMDQPIDFEKGSIIKLKVNVPRQGVPLTLKLESPTGFNELVASNMKANEWEVMGFNFSGLEKGDYNGITLIWDNGTVGDGSADWVFLVDEIEIVDEIGTEALLSELVIDGSSLTEFEAENLEYAIELAEGETDIPLVEAVATDEDAFVDVTQATSLPGSTKVVVIAEDGNNQKTYSIAFSEQTPLGLEENSTIIYPNPGSETLRISLKNVGDFSDFKIFDTAGRIHVADFETDAKGIAIDISSLAPRVYFIDLGSDFERIRFVKN